MRYVYLDNNATTRVAPEVVKVMLPFFTKEYGNASSLHAMGLSALDTLQKSRETIAQSINADPEEIFFTASGSEGDNLCVKGFCEAHKNHGNHIITSRIEHPAIMETYKRLERDGFDVTYISVDEEGFVDIDELVSAMQPSTLLVSIMYGNNEIGTVQDIQKIAQICEEKGVVFHTDAVQAYTKLPLDVKEIPIGMASFSGHKIHAPKGIGFIYKRKDIELARQIDGGSQELKLRAGTENIPYIVGLAKAVELVHAKDIVQMKQLQQYVIDELLKIEGSHLNGPSDLNKRVCNNINISFDALEGEVLLEDLCAKGVYVSTGSACSSRSSRVSPVLQAIECPIEFLHGNIRISLSKYTTKKELDYFLRCLKDILDEKSVV